MKMNCKNNLQFHYIYVLYLFFLFCCHFSLHQGSFIIFSIKGAVDSALFPLLISSPSSFWIQLCSVPLDGKTRLKESRELLGHGKIDLATTPAGGPEIQLSRLISRIGVPKWGPAEIIYMIYFYFPK